MVRRRQEDDETRSPDAASPEPEDRSADSRDAPTLSFESAPTQTLGSDAAPARDRGRQSAQEPLHEAGEEVGGHVLRAPLGLGGFGEVWRAEEKSSGREVALKLLRPRGVASTDVRERFHREARLAASLGHPNCVFVYGAEEVDGELAVSMELMEGGTLQDVLDAEGRLPYRQAVDAVLQLAAGLEAAQEKGIIHRDVKPSNCFLAPSGEAKIGDFGLSKTLGAGEGLTVTGSYIGTPAYSSPEQVRGDELDFRTDVFSLGGVLYHLITGERPFGSLSPTQVLARIVSEDPPPMSEHGVEVPTGLEDVVRQMLAKDPAERFASYDDLRRTLLPFGTRALTPASVAKRGLAMVLDYLAGIFLFFLLGWAWSNFYSETFITVELESSGDLSETFENWFGDPLAYGGLALASWFLSALYFFVQEARWGTTLGKQAFSLEILQVEGRAPGWRRVAIRSATFVGIFTLSGLLLDGALALTYGRHAVFEPHLLHQLAAYLVPVLIVAWPMRRRNGYAGLHDLWSGTRVVTRRAEVRRQVLGASPSAEGTDPEATAPVETDTEEDFGRLRSHRLLWKNEREELHEGFDPLLDRRVWIHVETGGLDTRDAPPGSAPREPADSTLRWLVAGTAERGRWTAFEAPPGRPFADLPSDPSEPKSWSTTRPILEEIARILDEDLNGDPKLGLHRLWIEPDGRIRILPFAWKPSKDAEEVPLPWNELLYEAAFLLVEDTIPQDRDQRIDRPLPRSARRVLEDTRDGEIASIADFRRVFAELANRPPRVTYRRRYAALLPVAPAALVLLVVLLTWGVLRFGVTGDPTGEGKAVPLAERLNQWRALSGADEPEDVRQREALAELLAFGLREAEERESAVAAVRQRTRPSPPGEGLSHEQEINSKAHRFGRALARGIVRLSSRYHTDPLSSLTAADRRLLDRLSGEVTVEVSHPNLLRPVAGPTIATVWQGHGLLLVLLALIVLPSLLSAFVFRGGAGLLVCGIDVQRGDGRRAGRLRCLLRAGAAWLPVLLPLALFAGLRAATIIDPLTPLLPPAVTLFRPLVGLGLIVLLAGGVYAIRHPERGLQDRIAGTWLMPR